MASISNQINLYCEFAHLWKPDRSRETFDTIPEHLGAYFEKELVQDKHGYTSSSRSYGTSIAARDNDVSEIAKALLGLDVNQDYFKVYSSYTPLEAATENECLKNLWHGICADIQTGLLRSNNQDCTFSANGIMAISAGNIILSHKKFAYNITGKEPLAIENAIATEIIKIWPNFLAIIWEHKKAQYNKRATLAPR